MAKSMRKLKDLVHLPLGERSSSSPSLANPTPSQQQNAADELRAACSATGSAASATTAAFAQHDKKRHHLTPLQRACSQGNLERIHELLLSAISRNAPNPLDVGEPVSGGNFDGWLPIHLLLASRAMSPSSSSSSIPLLPLLSSLVHSPTKGSPPPHPLNLLLTWWTLSWLVRLSG